MNATRPLNRSMTYQNYEESQIERFRPVPMNRSSSDDTETSSFPRSTSRVIMVRPVERSSAQELPQPATDSPTEDTVAGEGDEESSDEEQNRPRQLPVIVNLNRAEVLPFMFLGHGETATDARFLCEKRIFIIANLTMVKLEPSKFPCYCDSSLKPRHEIREVFFPVTSDTTMMMFQDYFTAFNSMVLQIRGKQIKVLVYSSEIQPMLLFATQYIMSYFKSEFHRAKYQVEGNLKGKLKFSPKFEAVLEHSATLLVERAREKKLPPELLAERRPSLHSISSADSPKKKQRAKSLGHPKRNNSVPTMPPSAFLPSAAISPLVLSSKSSEEENRVPALFPKSFPRIAWN